MKVFFTVVLILNFLTEGLAAISLIGGPQSAFAEGPVEVGLWAMHYGFAAISIASAVFWIWPYREDLKAVTAVLGILLVFHICIFTSLAIAADQIPGTIIHAVMAVFCAILFTQRSKWCNTPG